ncbi:MAG: phosphate signaling complex protein PhoU [Eubacterium sp.]
MRTRFDEQLNKLNDELIIMGSMCEEAITISLNAIEEDNDKKRKQVFEVDSDIDQKENDIEQLCMKLLLQQQPVASDLRKISAALKMISDMERIGDQASDIAEIAPYVTRQDIKNKTHLRDMSKATIRMVKESIDSFVRKDLGLAEKVIKDDDIVDKYFYEIKTELIKLVAQDSENGEYYFDLLMIAKYLERIGDHATNIAEWVEFSITGRHTVN